MVSRNDFFLGVYTNEVKDYCDELFFSNLKKVSKNVMTYIADNSENKAYLNRLNKIAPTLAGAFRVLVEREPKLSLFQRNVCDSANALRELFLNTPLKYFLIIESDVIPPIDTVDKFIRDIEELKDENWGIIGGIYYKGFHNYELKGLHKTNHVLSGCTVYKREALEKYPFRYDENDLGPFPDAWMSIDAGKEFSLWNDHDIVCEHLHTPSGARISRPL